MKFLLDAYNRRSKNNSHKGFSLVELSVTLAIVGVILGGALTLATSKSENSKTSETNSKLDIIQKSIEDYVIENQSLPCPADGTDNFSDTSLGTAGTPSIIDCSGSNFNDGSNIHAGILPVKVLNLDNSFLLDGWGRRFTYVVDYRLANNNITNNNCNGTTSTICFKYTEQGNIIINDSSDNQKTVEAAYVIISHGKNGHGAFKYLGGTNSSDRINAGSTDSDEQENSEYSQTGSNLPFDNIFVQKSPTATFDDIIRFQPKWQIIYNSNLITDEIMCNNAQNVVNNPSPTENETCTGAASENICEDIAQTVSNLCL